MINKYKQQVLDGIKTFIESGVESGLGDISLSSNTILFVYNRRVETFEYPKSENILVSTTEKRPFSKIMTDDGIASKSTATKFKKALDKSNKSKVSDIFQENYYIKTRNNTWRWFQATFLVAPEKIYITFADITNYVANNELLTRMIDFDDLTGLYNYNTFCQVVDEAIKAEKTVFSSQQKAMIYFDISQFKALNEMYGKEKCDSLLNYIAQLISDFVGDKGYGCRINSDCFAIFVKATREEIEDFIDAFTKQISNFEPNFEIICNFGIYMLTGEKINAEGMIDRATITQKLIKGSYSIKYNFFTEAMRKTMITEQELVAKMASALQNRKFLTYYQPQYNHSTGMIVGAEALVRWDHPDYGIISPSIFIPLFEKNGFVTSIDLYVFEEVCKFLSICISKNLLVVPISTNISRNDIFQTDFVERLEAIRNRYNIPPKYLRIEITEGVILGNSKIINDFVKKLHNCGYVVEMDDFGSGYSSLNVLKDIDLDIIKLDLKFLYEETQSNRGGTIISSIVRMAKWLGLPVIAEGVETLEQADFLKSIGCDYIQGYLYSKPVPEKDFKELLSRSIVGSTSTLYTLKEGFNSTNFWSPSSLETLIFSNYVGGAAIFDYHDGKIEILRVNEKYLKEMGMNMTEQEIIRNDILTELDDKNAVIYLDMIKRGIQTNDEVECETLRRIKSNCCGEDELYVRTSARLIGQSKGSYIFYAMIRNITNEKKVYNELSLYEKQFKQITEQVNIYYWEYIVSTKEMHPCFRCMRDLGLPALVKNYPEPAIEAGIIPNDYADMYRNWHLQIEQGIKSLEAIIPLTVGRVPFRVKYVTEFDENGRPIKAYGSATFIPNN